MGSLLWLPSQPWSSLQLLRHSQPQLSLWHPSYPQSPLQLLSRLWPPLWPPYLVTHLGKQYSPRARSSLAASFLGSGHGRLSHSGPELGGVVKSGWWAHHHNLENCGLHWLDIPPHYPLLIHLCFEEVDIHCQAWDAEHKSYDHFFKSGHWVFELPKLQKLLVPQQISGKEEHFFWLGQDIKSGEALK